MDIPQLREEAGLGRASKSTVAKAIHEKGLRAYRENNKTHLEDHHKIARYEFCRERAHWKADNNAEWGGWAFTDEMAIKVGERHGRTTIWRGKGYDE